MTSATRAFPEDNSPECRTGSPGKSATAGIPPTEFSLPKILFARAVKRLIWRHPLLYWPVGLLRKRGNVMKRDWDCFMAGYPRSANTFTQMAFLSANPGAKIIAHRHIPAFVLSFTRAGIPGMVLIRKPLDAAISASIFVSWPLEQAVAYWNDYYEALLPVRSQLFIATFEDVTSDFGAVMKAFNSRFGTTFAPFEHTAENAGGCLRLTEDICRKYKGEVLELEVCRPSETRRAIKEAHLKELKQSNFLRLELARANKLYNMFVNPHQYPGRLSSLAIARSFKSEALAMESPMA
jgi:hypothetical protein